MCLHTTHCHFNKHCDNKNDNKYRLMTLIATMDVIEHDTWNDGK